ncbi:protein translocase subunit secE/sec61 gamma [Murinocardiopsis flavida]|uniref:Protein translocase subunit SecE n=1 Tax=Murinocardiopsis flavida TaxID=645275 RepID=A0A2P8D6M5_9ACTN|nr:preprotein translocase subunit SecE [Murinocardiopsis flavida]PSK92858.1 protein translocase subunit secE/sec61 gamma [Murinocardiopsis flavida]
MTQTDADAKPEKERKRRTGPVTFTKQVVGELRKVRWPTRRELITYTIVVIVFVVIMVGYIALVDLGVGEAVTWLYSTLGGGGSGGGGGMPGGAPGGG